MPDASRPAAGPLQLAEVRRLARALSAVENHSHDSEDLLARAYRSGNWPEVIGVTGPPGAGKSTLVDSLTAQWSAGGARVAVLAVDPSSPYSGGAVLGDRVRLARSAGLENTYFRSLSSRGHVGGLTETATDLVAVLGMHGFERVIIETVGAGQSDVEVHDCADCTVVVTVPGLGDAVQASKAGLMEIGDVFAVNKSDLPGADIAARSLEGALSIAYRGRPGVNRRETAAGAGHRANAMAGAVAPAGAAPTAGVAALWRRHGNPGVDDSYWVPPVLGISASTNDRVAELAKLADEFLAWCRFTGRRGQRGRDRSYGQLLRVLGSLLLAPYQCNPGEQDLPRSVASWVDRIARGSASPLEAARSLLREAAR